jgi:uncharacterized protein (UPF0276 family)
MPTPPLPPRAGIGLRAEHVVEFLATRPAVAFVEAHSENYFGHGGKPLHFLERVCRDYPLSLHGVGLSIGSADPLSDAYLARLAELVQRLQPALVSDHLCWCSIGGLHANDLLPLPYTEEALAHVVARVQQVQDGLGRPILLENVSSYVEFADATMPEWEFVAEVARRSGCGLLLDVNNVFVSAHNHGFDAQRYLDALPVHVVQQMHLAGFIARDADDGSMLIDTHSAPVADAVWALYEHALQRFGATPTLIEWDTDLPPLSGLLAQAAQADARLAAAAMERFSEPRDACLA